MSHDHLPYSHPDRPIQNGGGLFSHSSANPLMISGPIGMSTITSNGLPMDIDVDGSTTTLGESGISSKASMDLDDFNESYTPIYYTPAEVMTPTLKAKPPPKPPRMRQNLDSPVYDLPSPIRLSPGDNLSSLPDLSHSSLADVTDTLDASVACNSPGGNVVMKPSSPQIVKQKIYHVLLHAKDFLRYELNPEELVDYLEHNHVLTREESHRLHLCPSRDQMTELLLDLITGKDQEEFRILCDALRVVSKQFYLADLLMVLDHIFDIVTASAKRKAINDLRRMKPPLLAARSNSCSTTCDLCETNNNLCEEINECMNFDIEIKYCDIETRQVKPVQDVAGIKKNYYRSASTSLDTSKDNVSLLTLSMTDCPDRYVPVLSINLYNQCLREGGMNVLADVLQKYTCVRELSLAKNHINEKEIKQLSQALQLNQGLVTLDIRLNSIGDEGARYLAEGLKRNCSLRTLNVTSTGLTGSGCAHLVQGLCKNVSLTEIDIGFNEVMDNGCKSVADVIADNYSIKKLRMRDNAITWYGAKYLFRALKRNSHLRVLDISNNAIGNDCMEALSEVLLYNRTLRELNLEKCTLSKSGCSLLARALKTNTVLKSLDLSMNPVRDDGLDALAEGLRYNHVLETLCLNMCRIGNKGFMKLLQALQHNCTMAVIKLCYNDIGTAMPANGFNHTVNPRDSIIPAIDEVYETLCHILQLNKSLKVLLWGNILETENDY